MPKSSPFSVAIIIAAVWGFGITAGVWSLWAYELTPGQAAVPTHTWPASLPLSRTPGKPTLIIALHPNCPCSRATIAELETLLSHSHNALTVHLLFVYQTPLQQDPATTDLWKTASQIPGVTLTADPLGALSKKFDAQTSGQTFLYNSNGTLLFTGGITASRGHIGDNEGLSAIEAFLASGTLPRSSTPVFGCSLR